MLQYYDYQLHKGYYECLCDLELKGAVLKAMYIRCVPIVNLK